MSNPFQTVKIFLQYKLNEFEVNIPLSTTFGNLKELAEQATGVPAGSLKLLFRGREKPDEDLLLSAGVKQGARIQVAETLVYRSSQPDPTAAYTQPHAPHRGQSPYTQAHTAHYGDGVRAHAAAGAAASVSGSHRAPETWEQFSSNGPSYAHAYSQQDGPQTGAGVPAQAHAQSTSPHAHRSHPQAAARQSQQGSPYASRTASAQASPQASPYPSRTSSPMPASRGSEAANDTARSPPVVQPQPQSVMDKIAAVSGEVDRLTAKADELLRQSVQDKKALRGVEEQFTQQLLALDKLEPSGDERAARKAQINRINAWADRLEALRL